MATTALLAERVSELRSRLESAAHLHPCDEVNVLFAELVELCCSTPPHVATHAMHYVAEHAPALRRLCAAGESALETHWSRRIAGADDPNAELAEFPYLTNYRDLVRMELAAVGAISTKPPLRVALLGSGPLPLTGLVLAHDHQMHVLHVDRDLECLELGTATTEALGLGSYVRCACADLESPDCVDILRAAGLPDADVVVLAALTGTDGRAKQQISARLAGLVRPDAVVLARSAARLRSLLYPVVTAEDLVGLRVELELHPHTDVVNSVLVARAARPC